MRWPAAIVDGAQLACQEGLARVRASGDRWGQVRMLGRLAGVNERRGRYEDAGANLDEARQVAEDLGLPNKPTIC